ncbi:MAG: UDP-N-acetylmuramoylalanine-D-glutamate ligase [Candidatus Moranbacteria bacterium GW2011_GWF2_36_839]|nr:MAG: UDP-N-acetylmuramoylalanine-D-glutamate ligase [Candidatus Moranbacteria bacterium GW2011_GWF1_36_78]KKQ17597.1 MAG: UDP-N-acetylmuramoylalanine-D-glutamate ligase [Candidatus Moranbacteria bacterium GW2011_GWF2_36_839]HAT74323.1 UDP-N-acetylmuramoyl-L-alanine--D-glutamate ligase [Candidatus Moranbacteria bacterium]HBY10899.1 UDP-N-acetylmuramoyl-L-alanine--D-glutamate ligase [Candidatus Moranbacteria bacterium]
MQITDLKNKKITVMGLGLHGGGVGTVRFLSEAGAKITVTDLKSKEELASSLEKLKDLKNISYVFQQHRPEDFVSADMIIKTPPVPWDNKQIKLALENKIPVEVDSSLFFKLCKNQIVGVTGTKGKTTTASLIYEILRVAGKNPIKVGIGQTSVLDKLKELKDDTIVIFELSSWRLSALRRAKISPKISVFTNIYPDHLNYYKSMEDYIADKKNIFLFQNKEDTCVINGDNEDMKNFEVEIKSHLIKFSKDKILEGDGVYIENESIFFNNGIDEKKIIDLEEIKLIGKHNRANIMAAIAVAVSMGIKIEIIKKAIIEFSGVAHRLEFVREIGGVKYINDTAATTPEAGISALNSFLEPIILICGGSNKNLNMAEFAKTICKKVKGVVFLKGQSTDEIITEMKKTDNCLDLENLKVAESMEKAVELAMALAEKGDIILLSPGSASFGLFTNEFDRGDKFREVVRMIK